MEKQRKDSKKCCEWYQNPSEEENSEIKEMVLKDNKYSQKIKDKN